MKVVLVELPGTIDKLKIEVFADLHIGDPHCDAQLIRERIAQVSKEPDTYCILNGDILNNATKTSVSDCYGESLPPMEQIQQAISLFEPIKDKLLAITTGNHERRTYNKEGIDLMEVFARQIGVYERFSSASALLFVSFGNMSRRQGRKMTYSLFVNHGTGGGRKEGAKAIRLADMASVVDADVYIHSHTHLPMIMKQSYYRVSTSNRSTVLTPKLFVNTSASLDYGGYGDAQEYKPACKDTPTIYLDGHKRSMTATL